jgi:hypothetical protein
MIEQIDNAIQNQAKTPKGWVVAKPLEASGLLKWKIRIVKAIAVLKGNADAFKYSPQ